MSNKDAVEEAATEALTETPAESPDTPPQSSADTAASPPAEASGDSLEVETLKARLGEAQAKADDHWEQLLRLRADMENLRKRTERELEGAHKYALERFALELLKVRDSLELGLAATDSAAADHLREGTELTLKQLTTVLEKFGIRQVAPEGEKFNPELHQAMSTQPTSELEPGHVMTVYQKGYTLNDRLLRPALVLVSAPPPGDKNA
jgi:molecular chaperone GrpE